MELTLVDAIMSLGSDTFNDSSLTDFKSNAHSLASSSAIRWCAAFNSSLWSGRVFSIAPLANDGLALESSAKRELPIDGVTHCELDKRPLLNRDEVLSKINDTET